MKSIISGSAVAVLLAVSLQAAHASTVYFNTANGDWAVQSNWYNSTSPTVLDTAVVPTGATATISTSVITGGLLMGGNGQGTFTTIAGTGTVNLVAGGSLQTYQAGAQRNQNGTTSLFNMSGGTCSVTGYFEVGYSDSTNTGIATISGGTLTQTNTSGRIPGGFHIGTETPNAGIGTLVIRGNAATIGGTTLNDHASGTIRYELGATGISAINLSDVATFSNNSKLIIDGSAYTGGPASFTLLSSSAGITDNGVQITYVGFDSRWQPTVNIDTSAKNISLTINAVPEAASLGLLGLAGVVSLMRFRR